MKKTLLKSLLERRVPHIIGSYIIAGSSLILFIDWLVIRYELPSQYVSLSLFGIISILPSVIILAYFHGAPGKDEWTLIEKVGIPINILFIAIVIFFIDLTDNTKEPLDSYYIHFTSSENYIKSLYKNDDEKKFLNVGVDPQSTIIYPIGDTLLNIIKQKCFSYLNQQFITKNIEIFSNFKESHSTMLDNFKFPKLPDSTDYANGYRYYPIKEFSQILNIDEGDIPKVFLQVFIYKTINLNTNEESLFFTSFGKIQRQGNISLYSTKSYKNDIEGQSQLIEGIKETLHNRIDRMAFSKNPHHSWVGEIIEVLPNDKVKIKLYDGSRIQSNLLLNATTRYSLTINGYKEWKLNGIKHQIEDIQLGIDYFKNNEPAIPDSLLGEYNELKNKLSYYTYMLDSLIENNINKPGHNWSSDKFYIIEVSEVFEKEAIGKLHSKYKPWVEIKVGHKLSIHK